MDNEIASAFVRIRPNMAGFQQGVTSEVRSTFKHAAKVAAEAFAVVEAFRFGKEIVQDAAHLQKSMEVIRDLFKDSSEEVLKFGEVGATQFGISAQLADKTAARFGVLFQNLKIAPDLAAKMTEGFIRLAGSVASIRGVDPSQFLQTLPLVAAGNLRGLKQLGIAVDQVQLKQAAFTLGLTKNVKAGLNPAQKAIAIYAVAMQNLDKFQGQVNAHSGDLLNVERRLSAEWSNAKDTLGTGLLPVVTQFLGLLERSLPPALTIVTRGFQDLSFTIQGIGKFVGPALSPIIDRLTAIKTAFQQQGASAGLGAIQAQFQALGPVAKVASVAVFGLAAAFGAAVLAASPFLATAAIVGGLAIAFAEAYKHSESFRLNVQKLQTFISDSVVPALQDFATRIGPDVQSALESTAQIIKQFVVIGKQLWARFGEDIRKLTKSEFGQVITTVKSTVKIILDVLKVFSAALSGDWSKAWAALKDIVRTEIHLAWAQAKNSLSVFRTIGVLLINTIRDGVVGAAHGLEEAVLQVIEKVLSLISKIPTQFSLKLPFTDKAIKVGFENPAKKALSAVQGVLTGIASKRANKEIADAFATNQKLALAARTKDVTDAYVAPVVQAKEKVVKEAHTTGVETGKAVQTGLTDSLKDAGTALGTGVLNTLRSLRQRLHDEIVQTAADVKAAVIQAQQNLISLGTSLADQLGQIVDKGPLGQALKRIQDQISGREAAQQSKQIRQAILDATNALNVASGKTAKAPLSQGVEQARQLRAALAAAKKDLTKAQGAIANFSVLTPAQQAETNKLLKPQVDAVKKAQGDLGNFIRTQRASIRGGKESFGEFAQQQAADALQKRQDTIKQQIQTRIANLTDAFNRGLINGKQFQAGITRVLAGQMKTFQTAGKVLGSAFALSFSDQIAAVLTQSQKITKGRARGLPGEFGKAGPLGDIIDPVTVLNKQLTVQQQIRDEIKRTRTQAEQAAAKKAAKAAAAAAKKKAKAQTAADKSENLGDLALGETG